jgi:hypothetical protein
MGKPVEPVVTDPRDAECFAFVRCGYDPQTGRAELVYRADQGPELVETVTFPHAPWPPEASRQAAFTRALELLHLLAGISYYKAGLAPKIRLEADAAAGLAPFLNETYRQGLAEFAYQNQLDLSGRIAFPVEASAEDAPRSQRLILPARALVAMGGGKDSLVGLDLARRAGVEVMPVCVGESGLIRETVRAAGLPLLQIRRQLAPELAAMNRAGAWNGHVPVTAINSAILLCAAVLYGFTDVVFSNERSADEATLVTADGIPVNHQYSKSSEFEVALQKVVADNISPDIRYFSILRPFSELGVIERFAAMPEFHRVFSSCNRNFHLDGPRVDGRWCQDCPKCRFAALGLALFLEPSEVTGILGRDLLDDGGQIDGYRALCALGRDKPFECVGEAGESRAAMAELSRRPGWRDREVVRVLREELRFVDVPPLEQLLTPRSRHFMPASIGSALERVGVIRGSG